MGGMLLTEYDISGAFKAIEDELIVFLIRKHGSPSGRRDKRRYPVSMWQAEQLKLWRSIRENQKRYSK